MTSSDAKTPAWNTKLANFSETLITQLRRGQTFHSAFQQSEQMIIANPKLFGEQKPQLDDNGDGFYSNTKDGILANKWVLGREGQAQDEPEIIDTQTALALSSENLQQDLWVKTPPPPVSISVRLPRSTYNTGETLSCNLDISTSANASGAYAVYAALIYPPTAGYFVTIKENQEFSLPNDIQAYRPKIELSGTKTLYPLEMQIPASMKAGNYQCCGVITAIDIDATDAKNWLAIDCKGTVIQ